MKKPVIKALYILPLILALILSVFVLSPTSKTVHPKNPQLKSVANASSGVQISWKAFPNAQKYRVFVKTGTSPWKRIADTTATAYLHKNVRSGTSYTYTVRCISKNADRYTSDFDHKGKTITYICAPRITSFVNTARGPILSWSACKGATSYSIYIKTSSAWKKLASATGTSYLHKAARSNTVYTYKIRCLHAPSRSVSACSLSYMHRYAYTAKNGVYTKIMLAADIAGVLREDIVFPTNPNESLTRVNAAAVISNSLRYKKNHADKVTLNDTNDTRLKTIVFYGYFYPDDDDNIYPRQQVTSSEYRKILNEAARYKKLKGKTAITFGDSILSGKGNSHYSDCRIIAEKYGMKIYRCAISGSTFSTNENGRTHIVDQIKSAHNKKYKADVIFLNGGTNDIRIVAGGTTDDTYDPDRPEQSSFAKGFHESMKLIRQYWGNTPVIYVRAHNIASCPNTLEKQMGEYGLKIAKKYSAHTVDIFSSTNFDTSNAVLRDRYTMYRSDLKHCDGTHPTYLGYTTYYIPLVSQKLISLFS